MVDSEISKLADEHRLTRKIRQILVVPEIPVIEYGLKQFVCNILLVRYI